MAVLGLLQRRLKTKLAFIASLELAGALIGASRRHLVRVHWRARVTADGSVGAGSVAILRIGGVLGAQVLFYDEGLQRLLSFNPSLMARGVRAGAPKIDIADLGVVV